MTKWFLPEKKKEDNAELKQAVRLLRTEIELYQASINYKIKEIEKLLKDTQ